MLQKVREVKNFFHVEVRSHSGGQSSNMASVHLNCLCVCFPTSSSTVNRDNVKMEEKSKKKS